MLPVLMLVTINRKKSTHNAIFFIVDNIIEKIIEKMATRCNSNIASRPAMEVPPPPNLASLYSELEWNLRVLGMSLIMRNCAVFPSRQIHLKDSHFVQECLLLPFLPTLPDTTSLMPRAENFPLLFKMFSVPLPLTQEKGVRYGLLSRSAPRTFTKGIHSG